jgi:ferrous iron transport protein B
MITDIPLIKYLKQSIAGARRTGTMHTESILKDEYSQQQRRLMIVGNPNVGKSVVFNQLTGAYVVVSNYPGTTVEVSRGHMKIDSISYEVVDTPGMYSLRPISEEEKVGRTLLLREKSDAILHVIDAKNLERMLPFTLQLIEAGFPVILALNMMDEARKVGVHLDTNSLSTKLAIPVVETVALTGQGIEKLRQTIHEYINSRNQCAVKI